MFSINQIHKKFSDFATAHLQINSYGFGDLSEIGQSVAAYTVNKDNGTNNITYPSMWVTPQPSSIERHFLKLNFMCLFYDLVNQNEDNSIEVISDTLQMANDFIQYLRTTTNEDNFDIDFCYSDSIKDKAYYLIYDSDPDDDDDADDLAPADVPDLVEEFS